LDGTENCLFQRSAVSDTALHLLSHRPSHQIGIKVGLPNLLDVQLNPLPDYVFQMPPHFINSLPPSPDNNARSGSIDSYRYLICLTVNLHPGDTSLSISRFNCLPEPQVFVQKLSVMLISIPLGLPIVHDSDSETYRMNFMPH
jgi:hypothetical protein